jgi:hypothetical protein
MKGRSILQSPLRFHAHRPEVGHEIYDDMKKPNFTTATYSVTRNSLVQDNPILVWAPSNCAAESHMISFLFFIHMSLYTRYYNIAEQKNTYGTEAPQTCICSENTVRKPE